MVGFNLLMALYGGFQSVDGRLCAMGEWLNPNPSLVWWFQSVDGLVWCVSVC